MTARTLFERLRRWDPADAPGAEPLSALALVALLVAVLASLALFYSSRVQPMQDFGHHVALSAVVADYHRPGSLYPALYEEPSLLRANTLLYFVAGTTGRILGVTEAVRLGVAFYLAGVPLATLYALRVFGRSAWPAVLSAGLVYNLNYVAGFVNMLFAAPFMIVALPVFVRAVTAPTRSRLAVAAVLLVLLFMAHAHLYLWTGVLLALFVLVEARIKVALRALLVVTPSLLVFAFWYARTFGAGKGEGSVTSVTAGIDQGFGAEFRPLRESFAKLGANTLKIYANDQDLVLFLSVIVLFALAVIVARRVRVPGRPVLEWMSVVTFLSYFVLPEAIRGQEVIGSRQPAIALLLAVAFAQPVSFAVSRMGRALVVLGTLGVTAAMLVVWGQHLRAFVREDAKEIECALSAAPPREALHFVKLTANTSRFFWFQLHPTWHVDKLYMGDRFGEAPDNPAINSTSPIRFRAGVDPHRITEHPRDWWRMDELWKNYRLVLVAGWKPRAEEVAAAETRATRLKACGAWELWQRK